MVMRKLLLTLLLASSAATPAFAQRVDSDGQTARAERQAMRAERQQNREDRDSSSDRAERQQVRQDRASGADRSQFVRPQVERTARVVSDGSGMQRQRFGGDNRRSPANAGAADESAVRAARETQRQNWQRRSVDRRPQVADRVGDADGLREPTRRLPQVMSRVPTVSNDPRPGTQPPARTEHRRRDTGNWDTNWRHDRRHDWRDYRNHHRSVFRVGIYYDPFGWNYQPYSVGWRLWPSYYSSRYWINDPWQYRLPYAPAGTQWVRYYNDAVLVDTWSGQVVDVIYNFFW